MPKPNYEAIMRMQERRETGQEGFRTGGIQDRKDSGQEVFRTGRIQDRRYSGQLGCRAWDEGQDERYRK